MEIVWRDLAVRWKRRRRRGRRRRRRRRGGKKPMSIYSVSISSFYFLLSLDICLGCLESDWSANIMYVVEFLS